MLILSGRPQWDLKYSPDLGPGGSAHDGEDIPMEAKVDRFQSDMLM